MRVKSNALESIENCCMAKGLDPKEIYNRSMLLLTVYRSVIWASDKQKSDMDRKGIVVNNDDAVHFLNSFDPFMNKDEFFRNLSMRLYPNEMATLVGDTMERVKEFPSYGAVYSSIIEKRYLDPFRYKEDMIVEIFERNRSWYYDRKKEAVLGFGCCFFGETLRNETLKKTDKEELLDIGIVMA